MTYGKKKKHEEKLKERRSGSLWHVDNRHISKNTGGRVYSIAAFIIEASVTISRECTNATPQL
jgi:hypothetical protein